MHPPAGVGIAPEPPGPGRWSRAQFRGSGVSGPDATALPSVGCAFDVGTSGPEATAPAGVLLPGACAATCVISAVIRLAKRFGSSTLLPSVSSAWS